MGPGGLKGHGGTPQPLGFGGKVVQSHVQPFLGKEK